AVGRPHPAVGTAPRGHAPWPRAGRAGWGNVDEDVTCMRRIVIRVHHEIGHEVVPLAKLLVNIGIGAFPRLSKRHRSVVGEDRKNDDERDDCEKDQHETPFRYAAPAYRIWPSQGK